jgi:hypothetical protein
VASHTQARVLVAVGVAPLVIEVTNTVGGFVRKAGGVAAHQPLHLLEAAFGPLLGFRAGRLVSVEVLDLDLIAQAVPDLGQKAIPRALPVEDEATTHDVSATIAIHVTDHLDGDRAGARARRKVDADEEACVGEGRLERLEQDVDVRRYLVLLRPFLDQVELPVAVIVERARAVEPSGGGVVSQRGARMVERLA